MRTKLEAIKWVLANLDRVVYFAGNKYRLVGIGRTVSGWFAICKVKNGWTMLDFDDCILSDLEAEDDNQFSYVSIKEIMEKWDGEEV